ncbi:MAG: DUF4037 domain-containing protein [Acutalibacteraceae bacterium]|nr:DUF4037 domain-containing protein [Acutalibacteraceae bacterium]
MKGLELSEKFYYEYGEKMIKENFAEIEKYLAVGLVGSGSECFGYDDEVSQDHDFEPGFCIFIPDESIIDSRTEFQLERAYAKLPKEFMGYKRSPLNPVGGNRHGVIRISKFFEAKTGDANADIPTVGWFCIAEQFPLEATNGKVFCDNYGLMTQLREKIAYMPEDVRLKKLAGNILLMAQSGQYNYGRCIKRGETAAAQLAVAEFVNTALKVIFLLNKKYMPYYKWTFRALRELEKLNGLYDDLEYLISSGNNEKEAEEKQEMIESVSAKVIAELSAQKLTRVDSPELERHAYSVNDMIKDPEIRNQNILYAV